MSPYISYRQYRSHLNRMLKISEGFTGLTDLSGVLPNEVWSITFFGQGRHQLPSKEVSSYPENRIMEHPKCFLKGVSFFFCTRQDSGGKQKDNDNSQNGQEAEEQEEPRQPMAVTWQQLLL